MGEFRQFLNELPARDTAIFSKLGIRIDIVEIWFRIANGQISALFDGVIFPRHVHIFVSGR